jgi:acetyltransferase-like isoleucine patch superfamily enzyme
MIRLKVTRLLQRIIDRLSVQKEIIKPDGNMISPWDLYKDYIKIHPTVIMDPAATIKIFNPPDPPEICLEIGEGSHIFSCFNLLRPQAKIKIGKNCQLGVVNFVCAESIEVGDDVLMAWGITLMDTDAHSVKWEYRKNDVVQCYNDYLKEKNNFIKNKDWSHVISNKICIGDKVWIGFNASILKGVTVGDKSIIGAESVVVDDVPALARMMGNPAKIINEIVSR